jgi:glutathione S-transferase
MAAFPSNNQTRNEGITMKLYGAIASPYVTRVLLFAKLKGVELPIEGVPGGSTRGPEYLKLNPIGKMPALDVSGQIIPESSVICDYLEDAYPKKSGIGGDAGQKARSRLIARVVDLYLATAVGTFFRQLNPATRDQAAVDAGAVELKKAFGYLEHFMGAGPFVVGGEPTLGDCALYPYTILIKKLVFGNFPTVEDPTTGNGRFAKWWNACNGNSTFSAIGGEYGAAVDGFMKAMAARR